MKQFKALTRAQWAAFWREKQNWFWVITFPLMFLVLFGFLFKDAGASRSEIALIGKVGLIDNLPPKAKQQFNDLFDVTKYDDRAAALEAVRKGDLDGAVETAGRAGLTLTYSGADQVVAATVTGTFQGFVQTANVASTGRHPAFSLKTDRIEDDSLEEIQFLAPGLLGWAIAMGAMFNTALPLVTWRTNQLLRRLRLSPVRTGYLAASRLVVCLSVALVQTAVFLAVGVLVFSLQLTAWWWLAVPLILLATLTFMAIGMIAGAVAKSVDAASGIVNVIILPMAFLSGSFIPLDDAPDWLRTVAQVLPLGQLNEGMIDLMVRGEGVSALAVPAAVLIGFGAVLGVVAAKLFRWEDQTS